MSQPKEENTAEEKANQEAEPDLSEDELAFRKRMREFENSLLKKYLDQCSEADTEEFQRLIREGMTLEEARNAHANYSAWASDELLRAGFDMEEESTEHAAADDEDMVDV